MPEHGISFRIDEPIVLFGTVVLMLWLVSERLLQFFSLCQPKSIQHEKQFFSHFLLMSSFYGTFIFSFADATALHWTTISSNFAIIRYAGILIVLMGLVIRVISRWTLGRNFSANVQTTEDHRLITTGIYGSIRHPLYLGYLCLLIGYPICVGSIGGIVFGIILGIPAMIWRIHIEENALERWFSEEYLLYKEKTCKLIPFLW